MPNSDPSMGEDHDQDGEKEDLNGTRGKENQLLPGDDFDHDRSPLLPFSEEDKQLLPPSSPSRIGMKGSSMPKQVLPSSPLLRSRCNKHLLQDEGQMDWSLDCGDSAPVQRSNVPHSPSSEEDLTRLKSAVHSTWTRFLAQLMNNNVSHSSKDNLSSSYTNHNAIKGDNKHNSTRGGDSLPPPTAASSPLYKCFRILSSALLMFLKVVIFSFILTFILYCFMVLHKPTQSFVTRHTQDLIYPFMRTVRFAALPFIKRFPQFHELYEDACLLPNPFFEMNDVSCWPCESVRHVIDLTGFSNFTNGYYHSGIPFIVKDGFSHKVRIQDLYSMYRTEEKLAGSLLLQSSHSEFNTFDDLLGYNVRSGRFFSGNLHVTWKINRAQYARMMRKYFSTPYYIPNSTEISVQHFLFVDEPLAEQYAFPVTEFANVFVMQAEGRRLIVLVPVKHCRSQCKAISVALHPKDVLFYNWLFWRPISFPMKALQSNELSVTYIGSFY